MRSLPESFHAKVTAIEESKDLDEIKIQELIGSLQTYELGLPSHKSSKSLTLKTIIERMDDSSKEDDVKKEVAFLAKNFRKFLKMKTVGSHSAKESFHPPKVIGRSLRRKMERTFNPFKELCVTNAMAMDISRRSVLTN